MLAVWIVLALLAVGAQPLLGSEDDAPIRIVGSELARIDLNRTDGGLERAPGVQTFVVFRADRERPQQSDGLGWTYHHHPDLACWKGRLYVGWDSCERDEDTWPWSRARTGLRFETCVLSTVSCLRSDIPARPRTSGQATCEASPPGRETGPARTTGCGWSTA